MKKFLTIIFIVLISSCKDKIVQSTNDLMPPNTDKTIVESDFNTWWIYHNNNIVLSSDFVAHDEQSEVISKKDFFELLINGNYIPLKLVTKDDRDHYELFRLDPYADRDIQNTIKNTTKVMYRQFKMEGADFPDFHFTDLKGNEYTNLNTRGKTVIIKCWFIGCKPCIAEFPELNRLVDKYKDRGDYLFISLAMDSKIELEKFLKKKPLNYETIPDQKEFMTRELGILQYPTHLIINQQGGIEKVVNTVNELISFLDNGQIKNSVEAKIIVPPPPAPIPSN